MAVGIMLEVHNLLLVAYVLTFLVQSEWHMADLDVRGESLGCDE